MVDPFRASILGLLLAASLSVAHADDQIRSTQEELRRRNVYFGEIDGAPSPELTEAIKHYQERKGFAATGQPDRQTLRSLDLLPRQPGEAPPPELAWPSEPVLKSDVKVDVPAEAQEIAQDTGVSPATLVPVSLGLHKTSLSAPTAPDRASRLVAARERASESRTRSLHAKPPEIGEFINGYLKAASRNDLREEIRYYADHLSYFENGSLDRRIVERVLRDYDLKWAKRRYQLEGPVQFQNLPRNGQITVVFHVNFVLKNGRVAVKGKTENRVIIDAATADPRIVSIQERRIRG